MEQKNLVSPITKFARERDWVPDLIWYQINGQSAQESFAEQQEKLSKKLREKMKKAKQENESEDINITLSTKEG
jgi:hypothetical protein